MTTCRRARRRSRLTSAAVAVEALELRRLLNADIVVNNTLDETTPADGLTSLREAITQAQTDPGNDNITFDPSVFTSGSQHTIFIGATLELTGANGAVNIQGPGAGVLDITGANLYRIFKVDSGAFPSISGMKLSEGLAAPALPGDPGGGAIFNQGTVNLSDLNFVDNVAAGANGAAGDAQTPGGAGITAIGGAIDNTSIMTLNHCTFSGNIAQGGNGGSGPIGGGLGGSGEGGALYSNGSLLVNNCSFLNNHAGGGTAGQFIGGDSNTSSGSAAGGDIGIGVPAGATTLSNSTFSNSFARAGNGAKADSTFAGGHGGVGEGGSVYTDSSNLQISNCSFGGESAFGGDGGGAGVSGKGGTAGEARGGFLYNDGSTTLDHVIIDTVDATAGNVGGLTSTGPAGTASGGAIYNLDVLHLTNVSISKALANGGNADNGSAGGDAHGGGIANVATAALDLAFVGMSICSALAGGSLQASGGEARGGALYSENSITMDTTDVNSSNASGGNSGNGNTINGVAGANALGGGLFLQGTLSTITNSSVHGSVAHGGKGSNAVSGTGGNGGEGIGGGIYDGVNLALINSTVYGNHAFGGTGGNGVSGGGNGGNAIAGAIAMDNITLNVTNATIANNEAAGGTPGSGPPDGTAGVSFGGALTVSDVANFTNTIISDNSAGNGADLFGTVTLVHSLVSTPVGTYILTAGSHDNLLGTPADLGPLGDNGGPTATAVPNTTSPAINAGDNAAAIAAGLTFDQRGPGFPRIVQGTVDIGAVEVPLPVLTLIGNGKTIPEDDTTPSSLDFTDFGTAKLGTPIDRTFSIRNDGTADLNLGFISLPFGFSVLTPFTSPVAAGDTTNFTIRFNPGLPGAFGGDVQISNNTSQAAKFDFTIAGNANGGAFRVNFQPAASEVPSSYLLDAGQVFGNRGNGYSYGWDGSAASFTRERNAVNDQAKDTLIHTQLFGTRNWEVSVPNGTYKVHVVAGDPSFFDSIYKVNVEGMLTVNGTPSSGNRFVEGTKTVTVTDGKLTITNATGAKNNKLDFVEVTPVYNINFQPSGAPVPAGYQADTGQTFGIHGAGMSYGWNASASSFARDRNAASSPDQRYDTLIHTQLFGNRTWELAVPNGSYEVHLVAGDPNFTDSVYKYDVEGILTVNGTPSANKHWIEGTQTVLVLDGKLTITNVAGASNNKIAFVDVTAL